MTSAPVALPALSGRQAQAWDGLRAASPAAVSTSSASSDGAGPFRVPCAPTSILSPAWATPLWHPTRIPGSGCQRNRVNSIVNGSYILAVAVALSLLASSCGHGSEDTSGPDPTQAATSEGQSKPDLSPATRIEIQARALSAACLSASCDTKPVYAHLHAGPDLRAALRDAFGTGVEFLSHRELQDATGPHGTYAGATLFDVTRIHFPANDVAAVDVWVGEGFGTGKATTFLFRWSGARWEPVTSAETGITVTTAVS